MVLGVKKHQKVLFLDIGRGKNDKNGQKLTNPESLAKNVLQTGMVKSKVRVFSKFDSFDENPSR